jgi:hypothetical protein
MAFEGVHVRDWEVGLKGRVAEASKKEWINRKAGLSSWKRMAGE